MNTDLIIMLSLGGSALWAYIIYSIIRAANDTAKRDKIQLQKSKVVGPSC